MAGCAARAGGTGGKAERDASLRQIATAFAADNDLAAASAAVDRLKLANPGQLLLSMAEADLNGGRPDDEVRVLAELAGALGASSPRLIAALAPPTEAPTPIPPTSVPPTPAPPAPAPPTGAPRQASTPATIPTAAPEATGASTAAASPTAQPPAPTAEPPSAIPPTAAPPTPEQAPRVVADGTVNLRSGPGKNYPAIGRLQAGSETPIIGRNKNGDWWRIDWAGQTQAWVAGTVVRVLGAIDTVVVASDIPAPPVVPTRAPAPTAPPQPPAPAQPSPAAGPDFRLTRVHLYTVQENGGFYDGPSVHCGEKRELWVHVLDAAGNPLNGVPVRSKYIDEEHVTGVKAPGAVEFVLGSGQAVYIPRDADGRAVTSDVAEGLSTNPAGIAIETLIGGGFCRDAVDCAHFVGQNGCYGHYSWDVTFQRSY